MFNKGQFFSVAGFKVGDRVKVIEISTHDLTVGEIYTLTNFLGAPCIKGNKGDIQWNGLNMNVEKVEEVHYEDDWVLFKGGVEVPVGADVSLSQAGYVVAFRPVKKPSVQRFVRWVGNDVGNGTFPNQTIHAIYKLVFTVTDGELTDVRLEK